MKHYIEFLRETDKHETIFDHAERRLFEYIAVNWFEGKPLSVTDTMQLDFVGSPATVHRKLSHLILTGMVKTKYQDGNRRTKYVVLTNWGINYMSLKARAMRRALNEKKA